MCGESNSINNGTERWHVQQGPTSLKSSSLSPQIWLRKMLKVFMICIICQLGEMTIHFIFSLFNSIP